LELVILIGLQAAGKSTFRRARFDGTHAVVSKDHFPNNRRPARRQEQLIREALGAEKSVVVDNTNARREDREQLVQLARSFRARAAAYFLPSSVEESLERNARREGRARVHDVGIRSTARALVVPSWSEGFDELYEVTWGSNGGFVIRPASFEPAVAEGFAVAIPHAPARARC
jgi:predicted kinase